MKKEVKRDKRRLVKAYWSSITAMCSLVLMGTPAFAASGGTIWDRFSSIMQDVYGQLVAISTIVAVTVAAVALIVRMVSRNQRAVDEATSWLKRIVITWIVLNVWFLRAFNSSVGQYIANGGALTSGQGSIFLWFFCALAFLKTAQRFDSYLASLGLNVAQTGSSMGMEMVMAARVLSGVSGGAKSAGNVFKGGSAATGTGAAASGFASALSGKFKGNSYVRDAVVDGGQRMGMDSAILLGASEETALATLAASAHPNRPEFRFDRIYPHIHFVPLDSFGARMLKLLLTPDRNGKMLNALFDPEDRVRSRMGLTERDAVVGGVSVLSHFDGDIARLMRFREAAELYGDKYEVLCFQEQAGFVAEYMGTLAAVRTITLDEIEEAMGLET